MSNEHDKPFRVRVTGKAEMQALTDRVMAALESASLTQEMLLLHDKVFARSADVLFDTSASQESNWTFKPMVELLLFHVLATATSPRAHAERQQDIRWAIEMAGFPL